jgi:NitT/TauT family transport system permease protein
MTVEGTPDSSSATFLPEKANEKPIRFLSSLALIGKKRIDLLPGIVFLALWEYVGGRYVDLLYTSKPSLILMRTTEYIMSADGLHDIRVTFTELGWGFLVGAVGGIALGYILGASKTLARIFEPYIMISYGVPQSALAPLLIIWFGIGLMSKIFIVGMMVFFLIFYNTFLGVRSVEPEFIHIAQIIGANRWQVIRRVIIPSVAPYIFMGFKVSIPRAAIGVIIGEFVASRAGVGHYILFSTGQFDTAGIFTGIIILLFSVLLGNLLLEAIRSRVLRWQDIA